MSHGQVTGDRIERERAFHDDRFATESAGGSERDRFYDHVDGAVAALRDATAHLGPGDRVLELGCGANSLGWELAERGCDVVAIDISPVAVAHFSDEAAQRGIDTIEFVAMNAETLDFDADSFDAVVGTGILHHLDLDLAYGEVARVLRPAGQAVFYEPLGHNPLINAYRDRTPDMRTIDEHPLTRRDIRRAATYFGSVRTSMHECASLGAALAPTRIAGRVRPVLHGLDRAMLALPGFRWLAWITVIRLSAPHAAEHGC